MVEDRYPLFGRRSVLASLRAFAASS